MSDTTSKDDELRDFIGMAMYGFKYHDYCLAPMTEPRGKYPYPGAIHKLNQVMARIKQYGIQERIDELDKIEPLTHEGRGTILWEMDAMAETIAERKSELTALKDKENKS